MAQLAALPLTHGTRAARVTLAAKRIELTGVDREDALDLLLLGQQSALEAVRLLESRNPRSPLVEDLKRIGSRAVTLREKIGAN